MENEKDLKTQPEPEDSEQSAKSEGTGSSGNNASVGNVTGDADSQRLLQEKQELSDRLLRKQAELDNFRKRTQREKEDFLQHATADLLRALLPTLDGFERALKHRDASVPEQFYKGIELLYKELSDVL